MHSNASMIKVIKTHKELDVSKPKYKPDNVKHDWTRDSDKRKIVE
jgi:hypothetical protein